MRSEGDSYVSTAVDVFEAMVVFSCYCIKVTKETFPFEDLGLDWFDGGGDCDCSVKFGEHLGGLCGFYFTSSFYGVS